MRKEKERYQELQTLLKQGLDGLRRQQDAAYQAELEFRRKLRIVEQGLNVLLETLKELQNDESNK